MSQNIQRSSIRKRYVIFSILIVSSLLICVIASQIYVSGKSQQSRQSLLIHEEAEKLVYKIQKDLANSQNIITEHLLLASPASILRWKTNIRTMKRTIAKLGQLPWANKYKLIADIKQLEKTISLLDKNTLKLLTIRLDTNKQFPALYYSSKLMLPHYYKFQYAIKRAIKSMDETEPGSTVERHLTELRSLWAEMTNYFQIYSINRLTSLSTNSMSENVRKITQFNIEIRRRINLLKQLDKKNLLGSEASASVKQMSYSASVWFRYFKVVAAINNGTEWRSDRIIRSKNVQPAYLAFNKSLNKLMAHLDRTSVHHIFSLTKTMNDVTFTLWSLTLTGIAFIFFSYFYFNSRILRPVDRIAEALHAEVNGKALESMPEAELREAHNLINAFSNMKDHIDQKHSKLEHQALHDSLTQLPNRFMLERTLQSYIDKSSETNPVTLMVMDLDHFKHINDSLGHRTGDKILRQVGQRIKSLLRETDIIARLGGDEFAILLPESDLRNATLVAKKINSEISTAFSISGHTLNIGCSIGIASFPLHADSTGELLNAADMAMYYAKKTNLSYSIYSPTQTECFEHLLAESTAPDSGKPG